MQSIPASYHIQHANLSHAEMLTALVNAAYRPQQIVTTAWTHESDWVTG